MDIEVIPVKVPIADGHEVRLPNFKWVGSKEDLEREIESKFLHYGPIYRISVFKSGNTNYTNDEGDDIMWFAFVCFYSTMDYEKSLKDGKIEIGGNRVYIKRKFKKNPCNNISLPLYKAQDLLTYYFGFNCWTSEIVYMEREEETENEEVVRWVCLVRVRLPREDLCSEGVGVGESALTTDSPVSRGRSFSCARMFAFNDAMKKAFSKFIIIKLGNRKVTVEVDTTRPDPLLYDPAYEHPVVKVNDITDNPNAEEEHGDLDCITEEELVSLLDTTMTDNL